jgi:flagellar export protein FliJ
MKKFRWRLQRLLDVRQKQEDALRAELIGLTEQTAALRGRILMEKAMLRSRLADLRQTPNGDRLRRQQTFMLCVAVVDGRIAALQSDLHVLEQQRNEKIEAIMGIRKFRKALERLREQARDAHAHEQHRDEQNSQDENTNAAFARRILEPLHL